jgi:hypothetical protein
MLKTGLKEPQFFVGLLNPLLAIRHSSILFKIPIVIACVTSYAKM